MPTDTLIVIADAHLGADPAARDPLHRFLDHVPDLGDHLLIAGDLFEFLFVHARVMPRAAFPTLAALTRLRERGVRLSVVGGNHDRWARDLWERELGATFDAEELRLNVGSRHLRVRHGDGIAEPDALSRALGWVLRRRVVIGGVRWLHPDLLGGIVERMARGLEARDEDRQAAHQRQRAWVREALGQDDAHVLVLAHSHVQTSEELQPGRWYVNPGAWFDGGSHAVIPADGPPTTHRWEPFSRA